MKVLVIDSHKSSNDGPVQNLHWQNSKRIADLFDADLIWSYPEVNDKIKSGYDKIIFVHASHYAYTDYKWLEQSPNADLFYVTNEYNLGEPRTLWMACKEGRKYTVIANHPQKASKVVGKYVNNWEIVNLNSLIYRPVKRDPEELFFGRNGCVYYGSFRKDRADYFKRYLDTENVTSNVIVSTHHSNHKKFYDLGIKPNFIPRLCWETRGLFDFSSSLYIEDKKTHKYFNYLANRFYEALNYNCVPLFDISCKGTIEKSSFEIPEDFMVSSVQDIYAKHGLSIPNEWHEIAQAEKDFTKEQIYNIISEYAPCCSGL